MTRKGAPGRAFSTIVIMEKERVLAKNQLTLVLHERSWFELVLFAMVVVRTLFQSACVILSMENRHLKIQALNSPIDDQSVNMMMLETEKLLQDKKPFTSTWDLRECHIPSMAITWKCIRWAIEHKSALDEYNTELTINCDNTLRKIVNLVLRAFRPKCPVHVL